VFRSNEGVGEWARPRGDPPYRKSIYWRKITTEQQTEMIPHLSSISHKEETTKAANPAGWQNQQT